MRTIVERIDVRSYIRQMSLKLRMESFYIRACKESERDSALVGYDNDTTS